MPSDDQIGRAVVIHLSNLDCSEIVLANMFTLHKVCSQPFARVSYSCDCENWMTASVLPSLPVKLRTHICGSDKYHSENVPAKPASRFSSPYTQAHILGTQSCFYTDILYIKYILTVIPLCCTTLYMNGQVL